MIKTDGLLTACKVSQELGISVKTLGNWYKWYYDNSIEKPEDFPKLPDYIQERYNSVRYWTPENVEQLKKFQEWLPRGRNGVMGEFSRRYWSNRKKANNED